MDVHPARLVLVRSRKQEPELFPAVKKALEALVPPALRKKITPRASILADLGMDSLKVVELTVLLEKELGRSVFLPEWIASVDDPGDLTVESLARFLASGT
ncbi:MAG: hypothetical protein NVS2B9_02550 [Myxococcales bacterium]